MFPSHLGSPTLRPTSPHRQLHVKSKNKGHEVQEVCGPGCWSLRLALGAQRCFHEAPQVRTCQSTAMRHGQAPPGLAGSALGVVPWYLCGRKRITTGFLSEAHP